jgi:hypothetical protein
VRPRAIERSYYEKVVKNPVTEFVNEAKNMETENGLKRISPTAHNLLYLYFR